jgi:uncharacterized SAM-binding protein YcdF (DUF218 family)
MFWIRKIVAPFLMPISLSLIFSLIGLFLWWFTKKQKSAKVFVFLGIIILILPSYGFFSDTLLKPLEKRYPPLMISGSPSSLPKELRTLKWIAVLGGGNTTDHAVPIKSQLTHESFARIMEGVYLHKKIPGSKLILLGGTILDPITEAEAMARVAEMYGARDQDMVLEKKSRDTEDQAKQIQSIVGNKHFILVTSAYHMPRSMAILKKREMSPLPAPTDYLVKERNCHTIEDFYPHAENLFKSERAIHEYLGIFWSRLRNKL